MLNRHLIVFFSPAGSTRLIAECIEKNLAGHGMTASVFDLGRTSPEQRAEILESLRQPCCLWIGSPVYCDHAVPLVMDFIQALPVAPGRYAVPFVTWGGVTSGLALPEMAEALNKQQITPLAAAKMLAVHSSMWTASEPLGAGHPDAEDLARVATLVDTVVDRLAQPTVVPLDLDVLDYLSKALRADAAGKSLALAKAGGKPLAADEQLCVQCGDCVEVCPVQAITLAPFPVIDDTCLLCMQCVRTCPENAFPFDGEAMAARIRNMAASSDEEKSSAIFF